MRLVNLDAEIKVTFYDEEHEEWDVKTMTVEDFLAEWAEVPNVIELTKCEDCKWWRKGNTSVSENVWKECLFLAHWSDEDGYCSWAERKKES